MSGNGQFHVDRPAFDAVMRNELNAVLATHAFERSPLLSQLLKYLVEQTLRGQGDALKAYTVAVDGLGRPDDFDAKNDSYPRVQMVRLRKALEKHYAEHGPQSELCIYLRSGSYRVRLGSLAAAYPELYRPLSAKAERTSAVPESDHPQPGAADAPSDRPTRSRRTVFVIAALGIGVLAMVAVRAPVRRWYVNATSQAPALRSPVLQVSAPNFDQDSDLGPLARVFSATLIDGLRRSWTTQVHIPPHDNPNAAHSANTPSYRLDMQFEDGARGTATIYSRLSDVRAGTLIWTKSMTVPLVLDAPSDSAAPLIVDLSSPSGAIVSHDARYVSASSQSGYPCLLKYFDFLKSRKREKEAEVRACLALPVQEARLVPTAFAVRAFFALENRALESDRSAAMRVARGFASQAADADSSDAYAQFALARLDYISDNCRSGNYHTGLAVSANPYDPIIAAILAAHAKRCGNADAAALLDRAYRLRTIGDSYARLWLILAAIMQDEPQRIATLPPNRKPEDSSNVINYYLCETLAAAGLGHRQEAEANWASFTKLLPSSKSSNDARLRHIILSDTLRAMTIKYLTSKGVVTPDPTARTSHPA